MNSKLQWAAISSISTDLRIAVNYELGVYGKFDGDSRDFHWIAETKNFTGADKSNIRNNCYLGAKDDEEQVTGYVWFCEKNRCYAGKFYPSSVTDATGRPVLYEEQYICVDSDHYPELPRLALAFVMFSLLSSLTEDIWAGQQSKYRLDSDSEQCIQLDYDNLEQLMFSEEALLDDIQRGLDEVRHIEVNRLKPFYYGLLTESFPVFVDIDMGLSKPSLDWNEMLALLLPIDMQGYEDLSFASHLPSQRYNLDKLKESWDVIFRISESVNRVPEPNKNNDIVKQVQDIINVLRGQQPLSILTSSTVSKTELSGIQTDSPETLKIAVWGPPGSGKTIMQAKIPIELEHSKLDWNIKPITEEARKYFNDMRDRMRNKHIFPKATAEEHIEKIEYELINKKTEQSFTLRLEDRAGGMFESISEKNETLQYITEADALILAFDINIFNTDLFEKYFSHLTDILHKECKQARTSNYLYNKPVAICFTKADSKIESIEDLKYAIDKPTDYIKNHLSHIGRKGIIDNIENNFSNYAVFPVSAVGVKKNRNIIDPIVFYDDSLEQRILSSDGATQFINLDKPFTWVVERIMLRD